MNLAKLVFDINKDNEDRYAFVDLKYLLTYKDLRICSHNFADVLRTLGIKPGEKVLVSMTNTSEIPIVFYGCMIAGVTAIFVDSNDNDLTQSILRFTRATIFNSRIVVDDQGGIEYTIYNPVDSKVPVEYYNWQADEESVMLCTSATTGLSKLACHHHGTLMHIAETHRNLYNIDHSSVIMGTPKLSFGYGLAINMIMSPINQATSVIYDRLITASTIFELLRDCKVTHFFANPTIYKLLLSTKAYSFSDSVKYAISSSEPLPDIIVKTFRMMHGVTILNAYGSSETITNCCVLDDKNLASDGNIGRPLPGYEFRVVDDDGNECADGTPGVLMIRCDNIARRYYNTEHAACFRDGWYYTNDVVYKDDNSNYYFINRKNQFVKIRSKWTSASIIENLMLALDEVDECTVIFDTNEYGLLEAVAYVVSKDPEIKQEQIRGKMLAKQIESQNVPGTIYFVSALPRSQRNKRVINKEILDKAVIAT